MSVTPQSFFFFWQNKIQYPKITMTMILTKWHSWILMFGKKRNSLDSEEKAYISISINLQLCQYFLKYQNNTLLLPRDILAVVDHLIGVKFEMVTHDDMNYLKNKRIHSIAAIRNHPNIWISWGNVYFFKFLLTFIYVCVYIYIGC